MSPSPYSKRNLHKEPLAPGTLIANFEVLDILGEGGFAVVYRAHQRRWNREVALKVLRPEATYKIKKLAQRFNREIDLARRLEHPNVIRLYDFGETEDNLLWMAMELVRGPELHKALAREGHFAPARAKKIMLQLLSGLADAHRQEIVHRDLKPQNIMLTTKGADSDVVKILDFGVGKALGAHEDASVQDITTMSGGAYGTPRYMAPEQVRNLEIGPYTDVYAAGLIFFELLTGKHAIPGNNTYEVLLQQLSQPIPFPDWIEHSPLAHIIRRATEKKGAHRYPDALAFYDALFDLDLSTFDDNTERDTAAPFPFDPAQVFKSSLADHTRQARAPRLSSSADIHALDVGIDGGLPRDTVPEMEAYAPKPTPEATPDPPPPRRPSIIPTTEQVDRNELATLEKIREEREAELAHAKDSADTILDVNRHAVLHLAEERQRERKQTEAAAQRRSRLILFAVLISSLIVAAVIVLSQ